MPTDDDAEVDVAFERVVTDAVDNHAFVVPAKVVNDLVRTFSLADVDTALLKLAQRVAAWARPPTSRFHVGAAALGVSGSVYLGVNVELREVPLNHSIHAEQSALVNASSHGERKIIAIATTEAPCGHCRQFMNELRDGLDLRCVTKNWRLTLRDLLPHAFGPMDLLEGDETGGTLMLEDQGKLGKSWGSEAATVVHRDEDAGVEDAVSTPRPVKELVREEDAFWSLAEMAHEALEKAYAPYSKSRAGIAVRTSCGETMTGWTLECAAYNPSMSPLQCVITRMVAQGKSLEDIEHVLLIELDDAHVKYDCTVRLTLAKIAPKAKLLILNYHDEVHG